MLCAHGVKRVGAAQGSGLADCASGSAMVVWYQNPLVEEQRDWAGIAPELFSLILHKVQERRGEPGEGRRIVACAGVCRSWRRLVHQFCHMICPTPYIQFPSSLSQPGPNMLVASGDAPVQCILRRRRRVITLYYGDHRQFMLAARRKWRPGGAVYVISSQPRCFRESGNAFMGKLKANFWSSEFVLWDAKGKHSQARAPAVPMPLTGVYFSEDVIQGVRQRRIACVLIPPGSGAAACVPELSLPFPLPRSLSFSWSCQTALCRSLSKSLQAISGSRSSSIRVLSRSNSLSLGGPVVPSSVHSLDLQVPRRPWLPLTGCFPFVGTRNSAPQVGLLENGDQPDGEAQYQMMLAATRRKKIAKFESLVTSSRIEHPPKREDPGSIVALSSKIPEWDPHQHCWSLDFKGRASLPSLHNFQLVVDGFCGSGAARKEMEDLRRDAVVVLQLGKIGKGLYTMDYAFPLTAVQAFAICISSFSSSVGLEP